MFLNQGLHYYKPPNPSQNRKATLTTTKALRNHTETEEGKRTHPTTTKRLTNTHPLHLLPSESPSAQPPQQQRKALRLRDLRDVQARALVLQPFLARPRQFIVTINIVLHIINIMVTTIVDVNAVLLLVQITIVIRFRCILILILIIILILLIVTIVRSCVCSCSVALLGGYAAYLSTEH